MGLDRCSGFEDREGQVVGLQRLIAKDSRVLGVYDVTGEFDSMILARPKIDQI